MNPVTKTINPAHGIHLPIEVVTQTIGVLAKRRAGKSFLARRFAEDLFNAGQQVIFVDPKGDQWGLRSSADGSSPGLPFVILGGEHGDVPLEPDSGETVGRFVVEERVSALLDLSLLRKGEFSRFMALFLETVYRLKAREEYRTPAMLIIDEADAVAPQNPKTHGVRGGFVERMLGAAEDIVRRGGQRGIGCMLVTQRSAVLSKNVLTQSQMIIALRTIAPQDLAALNAWIDVHGTQEQRRELMESLPSLPVGTAWFWSPGWPDDDGIFAQAKVLPIRTFDSGATPRPGERRIEPRNLADVDLEALTRQMAETVERAKANDPKELRKRIAGLEAELAKKDRSAPAEVAGLSRRVDELLAEVEALSARPKTVAALAPKALDLLSALIEGLASIRGELNPWLAEGHLRIADDVSDEQLAMFAARLGARLAEHQSLRERPPVRRQETAPPPRPRPALASPPDNGALPKGEHAVLLAVAARGNSGAGRAYVTTVTGYKRSTRDAYLLRLKNRGYVTDDGGPITITDAGLAALPPDWEPPPTGRALLEHSLSTLPQGEAAVLRVIAERGGNETRDRISHATGYARSSRDAYILRLKNRCLVIPSPGAVSLVPELME